MIALGIVAWLVAALSALAGVSVAHAERRRTGRGERTPCGRVSPEQGRVTIAGVVEPGDRGPVEAPISGLKCVWFSVTVVESWREVDRAFVRDFDGDGPRDPQELEPARRGSRSRTESSSRPFVVRDRSGVVVVHPEGLDADLVPVAARDTVGPGLPGELEPMAAAGYGLPQVVRTGTRLARSETRLNEGDRVVVSGRVLRGSDAGAVLGGPELVVATREPGRPARGVRVARAGWAVAAVAGALGTALMAL